MVGDLTIKATGDKVYCDFVLDVQAENIISLIDIDPEHTLFINGTVSCPGLSKEPLTAEGKFIKIGNQNQLFQFNLEICSPLADLDQLTSNTIKFFHL